MTEFGLVLPFDNDDQQFRRGVEVGLIWEQLEHQACAHATVHDDIAEMVIRIAETRKLPFFAEPLADGWLAVTVGHRTECEHPE